MDNIFANVVNNENSMTELLRNFLSYDLFRNEFLKLFLEPYEILDIDAEDIVTQKRIQNCGQPDLLIRNDKYEILVEIKIQNASLTGNQPTNYLKHLAEVEKKNVLLILLIPKNYAHENLWDTLVHSSGYDAPVKTIYWENILDILRKNDFLLFNQCFVQFFNLISDWFETEKIKFSNAEVTLMYTQKSIPTLLIKLFNIVDNAKKHSSKQTVSRSNKEAGEYAIYFRDNDGDDFFYFGVWYDFWKAYSKPLCFGIDEGWDEQITANFKKSHPNAITLDGWIMSWIEEDVLNDENNCLEKVNQIIEDELAKLIPITTKE